MIFSQPILFPSRANINFLYCGKINFLDGKGDGPFNADFELEKPLEGDVKEELLRVSKLIGKEIKN